MDKEIFSLSKEKKLQAIALLEELERRKKYNKLFSLYPDSGKLRRELYTKHLQFFRAGKIHQERAAIAGNRCGKTTLSCYETTCHLTGIYPEWWEGRTFSHPVDWWAASNTSETTRDILQYEFLGNMSDIGSGMIPKDNIVMDSVTTRRGIADAVDSLFIKHISGGLSSLGFKSYDQGREKFQGTKKHGVTLDEEPKEDIYFECLTRLMTENGLMICTFTPLEGMSEIVLRFMNEEGVVVNE